jgi:Lon protease-like protein
MPLMIDEDLSPLEQFEGIARLFPLPNIVLFPFLMQGLHIFEPRYRQMTADALASDRLIAMVLLRPDWKGVAEGKPPIHDVACLGHIVTDQLLPDGRYNLQLRGLSRARILHEIESSRLYRTARVELLQDSHVPDQVEETVLRRLLQKALLPWIPPEQSAARVHQEILKREYPLSFLCDLFAYGMPLPFEFKQELLETTNIGLRVQRLVQFLQTHTATFEQQSFPPAFSPN